MNSIRISAVIAVRNEADAVGDVVRGTVAVLPAGSEVLVVDDGSQDGTADVATVAGARVLRRAPGLHGKGLALRDGIAAARGEIVVFLDGDGQDPPAEIPLLLAPLEAGADFVNGSKFIGTRLPGSISTVNVWGNRFMSGLVNLCFGLVVTDSQSGFRAIRRDRLAALTLTSRAYEIETEMLIRAARAGWRIVEVPVTRERRAAGRSGFRRGRHGLRILLTILAHRLGFA